MSWKISSGGWLPVLLLSVPLQAAQLQVVVKDPQGQPVIGANVVLSDGRGGATSPEGVVVLERVTGRQTLKISCVGYAPESSSLDLPVEGNKTLRIVLTPRAQELGGVAVTAERGSGVDLSGDRATEVLRSEDLTLRATDGTARAALGSMTGIDTRPCALCGSAGVGLQGLDPNYTEVKMDGMALMSGVGSLYGMDAVGVGSLSSLSVTRGATTAAAGGCAVAGSVDLSSRRPDGRDTLQLRLSVGDGWRHGAGITLGRRLLDTPALFNADWSADPRRLDRNDDGLTDTPQLGRFGGQLSLGESGGGRSWSLRAAGTRESRFAGDTRWEERDSGSSTVYGRDIQIRRGELRVSREGLWGANRRWSLSGAAVQHRQDSWYGATAFNASQRLLVAQAQVEQTGLAGTFTRLQLGWSDDLYQDGLGLPTDRHDQVPSAALSRGGMWNGFRYEGGLRLEGQDEELVPLLRGSVATLPTPDLTLRFSAGQGYRAVTLFSLDKAVHAGFDHVELPGRLEPERSLSLNLGLQHRRNLITGRWQGDISLFAVEFRHKAILRYTAEVGHLSYGNADRAYSRGVEARVDWLSWSGWHLAASGTWSRVREKLDEGWRAEELRGAWTSSALVGRRGVGRLSGFGAELRLRTTGPQVMPEGRGRSHTPIWSVLDLGTDYRAGRWSLGLDLENLLGYVQPDSPLVQGAEHEGMLDSALIYGPLVGRRIRLRGELDF